ncbi:cytochrome c assembly protein [Thalassotalea insulae]|uniref:Cytochrome c assembly protein n=1 Tax=Thalassotalea insulae TaxID=2056778 RepID=A0ABQ6GXM9_9GAMM|nr:cytochrome c biogenesis protein CcsA [Thalassotalea insulae]GLX79285.1 cytochrome c assembly protein [Thalassotalea insulae]
MDFSNIGAVIAFVSYLIATLAIVFRLFHPKGPNIVLVLTFGCIAIIFHTLTTGQYLLTNNSIDFALPNVISLVSLVITLTVTAIALRFKVNLLLPVAYGFAGIWQLLSLFIPHEQHTPLVIEQLAVFSHVVIALIAYCILTIATLYAFQVAYINMKLKDKNLTAVSHLPPLMQVESQLFNILAIGTFCLFLSQLIGVLFLDNFLTKENAHKTVLSLLALLTYFTILWGHYKKGWRGHRTLVLTISASILLTLAYFGSRFVKEFLLS